MRQGLFFSLLVIVLIATAAAQEGLTVDNAVQVVPLAIVDGAEVFDGEWTVRGDRFTPIPADDSLLAVAEADGTVHVSRHGTEIAVLTGYDGASDFLTFDPSGTLLVSANAPANQLLFWRVNPDQLRQIVVPGKAPVVFSGRLVAYLSERSTASVAVLESILNESANPVLAVLDGHFAPVTDLAFHPDGTRIATASKDGSVSLWDSFSGEQVLILQGHTRPVTSVAFSPDGALLASGSEDGTVRLWDVSEGRELTVLEGDPVRDVIFSADGTRLAALGESVVVWGIGQGIGLPEGTISTPPSSNRPLDSTAGIRGVARTTLHAGYHPMHTVGCPIKEREIILAVARSLDGALLVYTHACEGTVWLYADRGYVDWAAPLETLPVMTPPESVPLVRLSDTDRVCAGASGSAAFSGEGRLYPPDFLPPEAQATLETGIGVVICHDYPTVTIENCHYLGPGNYSYIYTRIRTDEIVWLVDMAGGILAEKRFRGKEPPLCPKEYQRGEVYGDPPDPYLWVEWALETVGNPTLVRTRVADRAINAYTAPDGEVIRELEPATLLNPVGEAGDWLEVLLPDMTPAWVLKEDVRQQ